MAKLCKDGSMDFKCSRCAICNHYEEVIAGYKDLVMRYQEILSRVDYERKNLVKAWEGSNG